MHPNPETYAGALWADSLCSFLVFDADRSSRPTGLVTAYSADHVNGHCKVAAVKFATASVAGSMSVLNGVCLLFDYLFTAWPFRKIYLEVPAYNTSQFESAIGRILTNEGSLRDYVYLDGQYWDLIFLSTNRQQWTDSRLTLRWFDP
jgi:hypothetical protein